MVVESEKKGTLWRAGSSSQQLFDDNQHWGQELCFSIPIIVLSGLKQTCCQQESIIKKSKKKNTNQSQNQGVALSVVIPRESHQWSSQTNKGGKDKLFPYWRYTLLQCVTDTPVLQHFKC